MGLHHQLQGFVEPLKPAVGVLSACAGFLPCAACTGAIDGEDAGQFSQEPLKRERTPSRDEAALPLRTVLLLHLVQHVTVSDGCGNNSKNDRLNDKVRMLCQLYACVNGVLDCGFPNTCGLVTVSTDRLRSLLMEIDDGGGLHVLENAGCVLCEGVRDVQVENDGCCQCGGGVQRHPKDSFQGAQHG